MGSTPDGGNGAGDGIRPAPDVTEAGDVEQRLAGAEGAGDEAGLVAESGGGGHGPGLSDPVADVAVPEAASKKTIGLAALAVMVIHLLARFGGFIEKAVLARFFGTGDEGDVANGIAKIFYIFYYVPEELLTHSLLPVFTRVRAERGEAAAWRTSSLCGTWLGLALGLVTLFSTLWPQALIHVFLPGYAEDVAKFQMATQTIRIAMLGLFCTGMGSLTYMLLNTYKRFVTPALGDVAQKAGLIIGTVIVCVGLGHVHPVGYGVGFILGGLFKIATHLVALGDKLRMVKPGLDPKDDGLRELVRLMIPLIGGTLFSKLFRDGLEANIMSRLGEGMLASLELSRKVVMLPVNVFPYALGIALFPFLSEWAQDGDKRRVTQAFLGASRMMIFVFLPITTACLVLGDLIVTAAYRRGAFDAASVTLTTLPFNIHAVGLVFFALEIIAIQVIYAYRDTKTPFVLGIVASCVQLFLAWALGLALGMGNAGIAWAYTIAKVLKVILFWRVLRPRILGYDWPGLLALTVKTSLASVVMAASMVGLRLVCSRVLNTADWKQAAVLVMVAGGLGLVIFGICSYLFRIRELADARAAILRKLKKKKAPAA